MKKFKVLYSSILATVLCLSSSAAVASAKTDSNPSKTHGNNAHQTGGEKVVGYVMPGTDLSAIPADDLTHINYAFANINSNTGKIELGDPSDPQNFEKLNQLKQKNHKLKLIISVGGWTWSGDFSNVAMTSESRQVFAASVVKFLRDYHLDGVDLDWEYPVSGGEPSNARSPKDKQNFTLLLSEIRHQLDQAGREDHKHYILTFAGNGTSFYTSNVELGKISKIVDWVNLMGYDFHGTWETESNFNAPLTGDPAGLDDQTAVKVYQDAGFPSKKIVLGMPFYGHSWQGCESGPNNNGEFQQCTGGAFEGGSLTYKDIVENYLTNPDYHQYWDSNVDEPYLYNPITKVFISYDNVQSIGDKTAYIQSAGLGGAMIWQLSQDYNNTLMDRIGNDLLFKNHHNPTNH